MAKYRTALPQLDGALFLNDGGVETTLIFHDGLELPHFAAFHILRSANGEAILRKYYRAYVEVARQFGVGLILESATWRASADWGNLLGYTSGELAEANRRCVRLLKQICSDFALTPIVISGCVGPRGDGYVADSIMSASESETYHRAQIETFASTEADMISAFTLNYPEEAIGIALAARRVEMPAVISFTVETDGRLPNGQSLPSAVEQVDAATANYPAYYMINCAHPTHFAGVLNARESWTKRIRGIKANASRKSHAELNDSQTLDIGNPVELGEEYAELKKRFAWINVMGGCCGTDHRHLECIAKSCESLFSGDH